MVQPILSAPLNLTTHKNAQVKIIHSGSIYFSLLKELITGAKDTLHLQYYIFDDDDTGKFIIDHLIIAVRRGVKVYLMADGYASQNLSATTLSKIKNEGIQFRYFEPLLKSKYFYFGRRLHHKIFVVDTFQAVIGGLNISNKYNDLPGKLAWLDFALYIEGPTAKELCILCWKTWNGFPKKMDLTPCETMKLVPKSDLSDEIKIRILRNDWVRRKIQISSAYHRLIRTADKDIILLSSYFLPGKSLRRLMVQAVQRGVRIRVVSAGFSDVWVVKLAERWLYDWLLRNNIELYEYQKNILHGKLGICDDKWFTLGSYNLNDISANASLELNLEVIDPHLTTELQEIIEHIIQRDSIRITSEQHVKSKNVFIQFSRWVAYEFIRMILYLFTFYFKQRFN